MKIIMFNWKSCIRQFDNNKFKKITIKKKISSRNVEM